MLTDILLDFDDTIYDTHGNADLALREMFDAFGLSRYFSRFEDFQVPYWETNIKLWRMYALGEIDREQLIVRRFMEPLSVGYRPTVDEVLRISDFFLEACSNKPGLVEGARDLLDELSAHYRLHIASNGFHEVQYRKLEAAGVTHYFDKIILSDHVGVNKPHPAFFEYALREIGVPASQVVMIGDNKDTDILGARRAGIRQIWFNRHPQDSAQSPDFDITCEVCHLSEIPAIVQQF